MGSALDLRGMQKKIGMTIYEKMTEQKITKEELSAKAKVAPGVIYQLRNFKGNPTLKTLEKIANALGLSLGELCNPNHSKKET